LIGISIRTDIVRFFGVLCGARGESLKNAQMCEQCTLAGRLPCRSLHLYRYRDSYRGDLLQLDPASQMLF
jgi:hypothetical protein